MTRVRPSPSFTVRMAQLRPRKGDVDANLERARGEIARAATEGVSLLVFPETFLSGYFLEGAVEQAARSVGQVADALGEAPPDAPDVILGFYEPGAEGIHNVATYFTPRHAAGATGWAVVHRHRKLFLPTYGVFQEARFVVPGEDARAFDTGIGRLGLLVCEDLHHSLVPTILALDGAELLVAVAATPARDYRPAAGLPRNLERWDAVGRAVSMEHGTPLVVAHLVGSEGGKLLGGGSVAYGPDGEILERGPLFQEALVDLSVDLRRVARTRVRSPMLANLRARIPRLTRELERVGGSRAEDGPPTREPGRSGSRGVDREGDEGPASATSTGAVHRAPGAGLDPNDDDLLRLDWALVEEALVSFLQQEVREARGFRNVVVGLSGGVDSAVSLLLSVRAFGADHVHAFLLPYATSSPESTDHAGQVAELGGVRHRTIPITAAVDAYVDAEEPDLSARRRGNLAARFRSMVLWDQAARLGGLVMGTGNKSERLLGYFTWHADDSPPVNPLGDLFKTQVLGLARHLGVPEFVVDKPPSADLVRGVTDETELGVSYREADPILHHLLRGVEPEELVSAGFDADPVRIVQERLEGTHWKREQPTVPMLSSTAIGEYYLRPVDL